MSKSLHRFGHLSVDVNMPELPFRVYDDRIQGNVAFFYKENDALVFAAHRVLIDALECAVAGYNIPDVWLAQGRNALKAIQKL